MDKEALYESLRDVPIDQVTYVEPAKRKYVSVAEKAAKIAARVEKARRSSQDLVIDDVMEGFIKDQQDKVANSEEKNVPVVARQVKSMIKNRDTGKDVKEMAAYNKAQDILNPQEPVVKSFDQDRYKKNAAVPKESTSFGKATKDFMSDLLDPISYRLSRMSKKISTRLREYEYSLHKHVKEDIDASRPFLKQMSDLRKSDPQKYNEADLALKNGDQKKLQELGIVIPREVLDNLYDRATEQ